jgi:hypothetical protein
MIYRLTTHYSQFMLTGKDSVDGGNEFLCGLNSYLKLAHIELKYCQKSL